MRYVGSVENSREKEWFWIGTLLCGNFYQPSLNVKESVGLSYGVWRSSCHLDFVVPDISQICLDCMVGHFFTVV